MEVNAYFTNIKDVICGLIQQAEYDIRVAVAWFTDREIFDILCKKAALGLRVKLIVVDDRINRGPGGLNFQRLKEMGGHLTLVPNGAEDDSLMHHKFCIIDDETVITGSYNWSKKAQSNDENITVISDAPTLAQEYATAFDGILARFHPDAAPQQDTTVIRQRLELIRNLILLRETDTLSKQIQKLRPIADVLKIKALPLIDWHAYVRDMLQRRKSRNRQSRHKLKLNGLSPDTGNTRGSTRSSRSSLNPIA